MDCGGYVAKRLFTNLVPEVFATIPFPHIVNDHKLDTMQRRPGNKAKWYTTSTTNVKPVILVGIKVCELV